MPSNVIYDVPEGQDENPELEGHVADEDQPRTEEIEPGSDLDGPPAGDAGAAPEGEYYDWRWRQDQHRVPRRVVSEFARSINAPSEEAILNWTQMGRDVDFHRGELRRQHQELQEQARAIQAYEARVMSALRNRGEGARRMAPPAQPAGKTATLPDTVDPNNPAQVLQLLASLPTVLKEMREEFRSGIQGVSGSLTERERRAMYERELQTVQTEATKFLEGLKAEGWSLPEGFDEETMINECNRLGLSADPNLSWPESFEIVAARRLYRHAYRRGMAEVAQRMTTDRKAEFRVPGGRKATPGGAPEGSTPGTSLKERAERAMAMGRGITVGEALGEE